MKLFLITLHIRKVNLIYNLMKKKRNYYTPKLHKNPSKARFFIACPQCCIKSLSKAITAELVFKQIEPHNSKPCLFSLNNFSQFKRTSQLLMQSANLMPGAKHL